MAAQAALVSRLLCWLIGLARRSLSLAVLRPSASSSARRTVSRATDSRDASFSPAILEATGGLGIHVVEKSLARPLLKTTWECIAELVRFVGIEKVDIEAATRLNMSPFGRCALIAGLNLLHCNEH